MTNVKTFDEGGLPRRPLSLKCNFPVIDRNAFQSIRQAIDRPDIEVIVGPRQSGKTTLLTCLIEFLQKEKGVEENQIIYSNLDWVVDFSFFSDPWAFVERVKSIVGKEKKVYLFLDEVQRLPEPGHFLKGVYDLNANIKLIISGSSSLELRAKTKEYLTGRKKETHLYPVSFPEWANHHEKIISKIQKDLHSRSMKDVSDGIKSYDTIYGSALRESFFEIMSFGGYPKVLLSALPNLRQELEEIYTSYVRRDVVEFMHIENPTLFNNLVRTLAHQIGQLMNYAELSSLLGGNQATIKRYVEILNQTYVVHLLPPLTGNLRNEIKHAHKPYFYDNGLRNFISGHLSNNPGLLKGDVLENAIFAEMFKVLDQSDRFFFWRTKAGSEVDFVTEAGIPVEVKLGPAKLGQLTKSFHSFLESHKPPRALFANGGTIGSIKIRETQVIYLPYYWVPIVDRLWQPVD